jgi:hypothetical protein
MYLSLCGLHSRSGTNAALETQIQQVWVCGTAVPATRVHVLIGALARNGWLSLICLVSIAGG